MTVDIGMGRKLVAIEREAAYPGIGVHVENAQGERELLVFVERNPDHDGSPICVGAYGSDGDEPSYYEEYRSAVAG